MSKPTEMVLGDSALQPLSADTLFSLPKNSYCRSIQFLICCTLYSKAKQLNSQSTEEESITNVNTVTAYINHFLLLGVKTGARQCWSTLIFTKWLYSTQHFMKWTTSTQMENKRLSFWISTASLWITMK